MYFNTPGPENTEQTLQAAYERSIELGIDELVIASTKGDTAYKALKVFKDCRIVAVTYHCGWKEPFKTVMKEEVKKDLEAKGIKIISATHALSGVERSVVNKFSGVTPILLIAQTLKLFGQGTKVAAEITIMAADAGVLTGKDIIAIGGTGRGADTAVVLKPANQSDFFNMFIREIICKPRY